MKLLIDANVFLEVILCRAQAKEAQQLLESTQDHDLFITDLALHSIGIFLFRLNKKAEYNKLLQDLRRSAIKTLSLDDEEAENLAPLSDAFKLDFDDAYQYAVAEKYELVLVSFDKDFDRTKRGKKTPAEILNQKT